LTLFLAGSFADPSRDIHSNQIDLSRSTQAESPRPDPADFSAQELQLLQKRFGVHGPQTPIAQLFTAGLDHWLPLRNQTLDRLGALTPTLRREAKAKGINPMFLAAILYDELQHAKPGEDTPLAVQSGLFKTHGLAQLGVEELIHQGLLPKNPSPHQLAWAKSELLNPERNIAILAEKMHRLIIALDAKPGNNSNSSTSYREAHLLATLAYLHNGKLDYPTRILKYMQDPALHGLVYGNQKPTASALI